MSRLLHPHCVSVIDFGVEGSPYLVMDFVTGRTLRELMLEGRMPAARAMRLAQQLLAGLAHAHEQGIVHRDLKPENLILSEEAGLKEHLRILDFGLAKLRDGPQMTAGMAVGTPSYMSPEQSGAEGAIDARTDLYTVGHRPVRDVLRAQAVPVGERRRGDPDAARVAAAEAARRRRRRALLRRAGGAARQGDVEAAGGSLPVGGRAGRGAGGDAGGEDGGPGDGHRPPRRPRRRPTARRPPTPTQEGRPEERQAGRGPAKDEKKDRGRPAPAATIRQDAKTTIDTVSAVRRRMEANEAEAGAGARLFGRFRMAWIGALFVVVALLALLIGRGLRHGGGDAIATGRSLVAATAPAAPGRATATPAGAAAAPSGDSPAARAGAADGRPRGDRSGDRAAQPAADAAARQRRRAVPAGDGRLRQPALAGRPGGGADGGAQEPRAQGGPGSDQGRDPIAGQRPRLRRSQAFLRSLGPPATPFIKEAAARDPSPKVRERAAELLGSSGRGWGSRPSSGGTMFRR